MIHKSNINLKTRVNDSMFEGKFSMLRNLFYFMLLGLHASLFAFFFYYSWFNYIIIISSLSSLGLVSLALYSFLTTKSYYYYFYIGIIISSIPLVFVIHLSAVLIVPELIILLMLMYRGLTEGETYIKTYETGMANRFINLTTANVIPKNLKQKQQTKGTRNPEITTLVKMSILSLFLTVSLLSSSIFLFYL